MTISWKSFLQESPLEWLLEKEDPSVRYFTLREILEKSEKDPEVVASKQAIRESALVNRILSKQNPNGSWEDPSNPYQPKYKSTYWQIMTLAQLGADKTDHRIARACDFVFKLQLEEGGFSSYTRSRGLKEYEMLKRKGLGLLHEKDFVSSFIHEHQYSCLTGNLASAFIRMGYDDKRVKKALNWLVKIQNRDGGWLCPYWRAHVRDKHGCFDGTICPLEAFSHVKEEALTEPMKNAIRQGAEFLLMHRLFKADHHEFKVINRGWLTLSFPFFYGYNVLRGLDVLTRLGYTEDERLDDAVEVLMNKRSKDGKWTLESAPIGRMQANIEAKGKPSKWITLVAMRVLKRLSRS